MATIEVSDHEAELLRIAITVASTVFEAKAVDPEQNEYYHAANRTYADAMPALWRKFYIPA